MFCCLLDAPTSWDGSSGYLHTIRAATHSLSGSCHCSRDTRLGWDGVQEGRRDPPKDPQGLLHLGSPSGLYPFLGHLPL